MWYKKKAADNNQNFEKHTDKRGVKKTEST